MIVLEVRNLNQYDQEGMMNRVPNVAKLAAPKLSREQLLDQMYPNVGNKQIRK